MYIMLFYTFKVQTGGKGIADRALLQHHVVIGGCPGLLPSPCEQLSSCWEAEPSQQGLSHTNPQIKEYIFQCSVSCVTAQAAAAPEWSQSALVWAQERNSTLVEAAWSNYYYTINYYYTNKPYLRKKATAACIHHCRTSLSLQKFPALQVLGKGETLQKTVPFCKYTSTKRVFSSLSLLWISIIIT